MIKNFSPFELTLICQHDLWVGITELYQNAFMGCKYNSDFFFFSCLLNVILRVMFEKTGEKKLQHCTPTRFSLSHLTPLD